MLYNIKKQSEVCMKKQKIKNEEILDNYWPFELILIKGRGGTYRFAVNHLDGKKVKLLCCDYDFYPFEVKYADFSLTDPDNMSHLSHNDPTKPFFSHFIKDFHYCKNYDNDVEFTAVQKTAHDLMKKDGMVSVSEILDAEKALNERVKSMNDFSNRVIDNDISLIF